MADDGIIAVIVALFIVVLLGVAALAIDFGRVYVDRSNAQDAADAAALDGASALATNVAAGRQAAVDMAATYGFVDGVDRTQLTATTPDAAHVHVRIQRTIPLSFGRLVLNRDDITFSVHAEGYRQKLPPFGYAVYAEGALNMQGGGASPGGTLSGSLFGWDGITIGGGYIVNSPSPRDIATVDSEDPMNINGATTDVNANVRYSTASKQSPSSTLLNVLAADGYSATATAVGQLRQWNTAVAYMQSLGTTVSGMVTAANGAMSASPELANAYYVPYGSNKCSFDAAAKVAAGARTTLVCRSAAGTPATLQLSVNPASTVTTIVAKDFSGNVSNLALGSTTPFVPALVYLTGTGNVASFSGGALTGWVYAPNGSVSFSSGMVMDGRVIAGGDISYSGGALTVTEAILNAENYTGTEGRIAIRLVQ